MPVAERARHGSMDHSRWRHVQPTEYRFHSWTAGQEHEVIQWLLAMFNPARLDPNRGLQNYDRADVQYGIFERDFRLDACLLSRGRDG